jgi:hypothetical protein
LRVIKFFVCYLFDVSLMNELYWHLGDIGNEYNSFSGVEGQEREEGVSGLIFGEVEI